MRFIAAMVSLVVAALLLVLGFGFKFFAGPTTISVAVPSSSQMPYVVIDPEVLHLHPGFQTVTADGAKLNTVGYGQTSDVLAWLGGSAYERISANPKTLKLSGQQIDANESRKDAPTAAAAQDQKIVSPAGSDMWLGESTVEKAQANLSMNIGNDETVIVSSDGLTPAPSNILVSWPLPGPQFLWMDANVLMIVGGGFLLLGIGLYIWALLHMRRGQGPRRRGRGRMPKPPRPRRVKGSNIALTGPRTGRRALSGGSSLAAVALGSLVVVGLSACSTGISSIPTPTPTSTDAVNTTGPRPVVSEKQLLVILDKVTTTLTTADEKKDPALVTSRLGGAALEARSANYAMRKTNPKIAALPAVASTPVQLFLPQTTELWPRSILVMVPAAQAVKKGEQPPTVSMVLTQESPRSNYKVVYMTDLEPKQRTPEVSASTAGSPLVALDTKLLLASPNDLAAAYGDVLNKGANSKFVSLFDGTGDTLRPRIAEERKSQQGNKQVRVSFADLAGAYVPVAFATVDAGAIVSVQLNEVGTFLPLNNRDLKLAGELKALSGIEISNRPVRATYGLQLLMYVPAVGSTKKIQMLGYSENLTSVKLK